MGFLRDITGHKQIIRVLLNALRRERMSHAYLFAGPEGVGKTPVAQAFAQALLCTEPQGGEPCGQCLSCRQAEHANHPDLHWISPDGLSIKIQQVREIQRKVMFRAYQGGRNVTVIEQAAKMTAEAANSLLKTLEEPPADTYIILLTDRPQALPATIISRCQHFSFKALALPELAEHLHIRHGLPRDEAVVLAAWSGGILGRALAYHSDDLRQQREDVLQLAAALQGAGCLEVLAKAEMTAKSLEQTLVVLDVLASWYRDMLVWRETHRAELLFNRDRLAILEDESSAYDTGYLMDTIDKIAKAKNDIMGSANIRLVIEALFLRLSG